MELTLSYFLDGSPISAQDLAGSRGRVTIRFTYKNTTRQTVTLGDRTEEIPIPFLVLSGLMLDGKDFSNVEAESGQVISDGDRFFVAGFAIPGLREDLGEAGKELDLPETFAVTRQILQFPPGYHPHAGGDGPAPGAGFGRPEFLGGTDRLLGCAR